MERMRKLKLWGVKYLTYHLSVSDSWACVQMSAARPSHSYPLPNRTSGSRWRLMWSSIKRILSDRKIDLILSMHTRATISWALTMCQTTMVLFVQTAFTSDINSLIYIITILHVKEQVWVTKQLVQGHTVWKTSLSWTLKAIYFLF